MSESIALEVFDELDSTQDEARRQFESGNVTAPKVIVARAQRYGRGTQGRLWESPKDAGVYFTLVLPAGEIGWRVTSLYTQAAALACAKTLKRLYGIDIGVKPVNDLIVSGRKLGGILLESVSRGGGDSVLSVLYTGIGLNWLPVALPDWVEYGAISLSEVLTPETMQTVSRNALITALADAVHQEYQVLQGSQTSPEQSETALLKQLEPLWTSTEPVR